MKIYVDTREKNITHIIKRFQDKNINWEFKKLDYGDYSFEHDGIDYSNKIVVERKANLTELAGNLGYKRITFETEFCKALAHKCKVILMVEDLKAREKIKLRQLMDSTPLCDDDKFRKTWRSKLTGNAMYASLKAFKTRYKYDMVCCKKIKSAEQIINIFENYIKSIKFDKQIKRADNYTIKKVNIVDRNNDIII